MGLYVHSLGGDLSLQAHLGMESIHEWWEQKAETRRRRRDLRTQSKESADQDAQQSTQKP